MFLLQKTLKASNDEVVISTTYTWKPSIHFVFNFPSHAVLVKEPISLVILPSQLKVDENLILLLTKF